MVFRKLAGPTFFCEYEVVLGADFWPALASLASLHGDDTIDLLTIDPDPVTYYSQAYGTYACFSIGADASKEQYWDALAEAPSGDPTGAIAYTADAIAIAGQSGSWGCWGDRSLGIALFRLTRAVAWWTRTHGPFLGVEEAVEHFVSQSFRTSGVPSDLAAALTDRYPSSFKGLRG